MEWISVDKELPEMGDKVVVLYKDWSQADWDATDFDYLEICSESGVEYFAGALDNEMTVTHWMPLPSPPKDICR